jgi:Holliday junction resolvasome RuvABC endonuclease subunit
MSRPKSKHVLVLGIHPTSRGMSWIVFDGPFVVFDWGNTVAKGRTKNSVCMRKLEVVIERVKPETIVLETFEKGNSRRNDRITRLCRSMVSLAADRGVEVAIYARRDVQSCFAGVGATTRHEIAEAVVRHVDALRHQMPSVRKPWESEDRRMPLFSAAALALTHFHRNAAQVFDDLLSA